MAEERARKRYWAYVHDEEGDLVKDLGDFDLYRDALDAAGYQVERSYVNDTLTYNNSVRVVDNDLADGTTVWYAGPVKRDSEMRSVI